ADVPDAQLLKFPFDPATGFPPHSLVERPRLSQRERDAILGLSCVVDLENLTEVMGVVIRKQYRKDGGDNFVWGAMTEIGRSSGDSGVHERIKELYQHCMLERAE